MVFLSNKIREIANAPLKMAESLKKLMELYIFSIFVCVRIEID